MRHRVSFTGLPEVCLRIDKVCLPKGFGFIALVLSAEGEASRGEKPTPVSARQSLARRSGRSPALPYPPARPSTLYHEGIHKRGEGTAEAGTEKNAQARQINLKNPKNCLDKGGKYNQRAQAYNDLCRG
jgi:hypothetical protein